MTLEAMGCQQAIAPAMTEQGADDVLALKANHHTVYDEGTRCVAEANAPDVVEMAHAGVATVDGDHGRLATRTAWGTSAMEG